jgi:hypothetical protein
MFDAYCCLEHLYRGTSWGLLAIMARFSCKSCGNRCWQRNQGSVIVPLKPTASALRPKHLWCHMTRRFIVCRACSQQQHRGHTGTGCGCSQPSD